MTEHCIAIVGATGAVGIKTLTVLDERVKNIGKIRLFASEKSAGKHTSFRGSTITVENLATADLKGIDVAFFSAGTQVSKDFSSKFVEAGAVVIDNSNAYRMLDQVPLVVPEINPEAIGGHNGIIANPNCSTIQLMVAVGPIHKVNPIKRMVVSTYQSVSGTGIQAIKTLEDQSRAVLEKKQLPQGVYPHPIAFNLIPQIDVLEESGMYREEEKMINESRKILGSNIRICPTTVRVPVFFCHSESVNLELTNPCDAAEIRQLLSEAEDVVIMDDPANSVYPYPLFCQDRDEVFVGRIRNDNSVDNGINMWVVADNLRRGAATNAVKIYTKMLETGLI